VTTAQSEFDPVAYKETTRDQWDGADGWAAPCRLLVGAGTR
jgi:hypothetical protein